MYIDIFIITASKIILKNKDIDFLNKISQKINDWNLLLETAYIHGVASFIYYTLKKYELINIIPTSIYNALKNIFYVTVSNNLRHLQIIKKIDTNLHNKIVLLKGIDLIESLYPNIGIRSMCDIDILVEKKNSFNIADYLFQTFKNENTYTFKYESPVHKKIAFYETQHLPPIVLKNGIIELHYALNKYTKNNEITTNAWKTIIPYNKSVNIYRLSNEMMLLHLCMHFYSHSHVCVILRMLCDINEMINKYNGTLHWDVIHDLCINTEIKDQVSMALTYTVIYFDTNIPNYFIDNSLLKKNTKKNLLHLIKGIPTKNKNKYLRLYTKFKILKNKKEILLYIYRSILPEKEFLYQQYQYSDKKKTIILYLKYWKYLLFKLK